MNQLTKQVVIFTIGFFALFCLLGIVGSADYSEQVVYTMPQEAYEAIFLKLGSDCSDRQIAKEYMSNKEFYDSLSN